MYFAEIQAPKSKILQKFCLSFDLLFKFLLQIDTKVVETSYALAR